MKSEDHSMISSISKEASILEIPGYIRRQFLPLKTEEIYLLIDIVYAIYVPSSRIVWGRP